MMVNDDEYMVGGDWSMTLIFPSGIIIPIDEFTFFGRFFQPLTSVYLSLFWGRRLKAFVLYRMCWRLREAVQTMPWMRFLNGWMSLDQRLAWQHLPPIWEWFTPTIYGDDWGMVYYCYTHITALSSSSWPGRQGRHRSCQPAWVEPRRNAQCERTEKGGSKQSKHWARSSIPRIPRTIRKHWIPEGSSDSKVSQEVRACQPWRCCSCQA